MKQNGGNCHVFRRRLRLLFSGRARPRSGGRLTSGGSPLHQTHYGREDDVLVGLAYFNRSGSGQRLAAIRHSQAYPRALSLHWLWEMQRHRNLHTHREAGRSPAIGNPSNSGESGEKPAPADRPGENGMCRPAHKGLKSSPSARTNPRFIRWNGKFLISPLTNAVNPL